MEPWRAGAAPSFATSAGQSKHSTRSPTRSAWCRTFDRTMACCSAASGVATIRGPCRSSTRWHSKGSSLTAPPSPPSCWRWRRRWRQLATPRCERLLPRPRLAHWLISQCVATARRTSTIGLESCPPSLSLQRRRGTARLTTPWSLRHGRLPSREDSGRLGTSSGLCDPTGAPERQPAQRPVSALPHPPLLRYRPTDELIAFVKNGGKDPEPDDEVAPSESGEAGEQGSQKRQAS
eukprot:COSAG04_NODE_1802_length_5544_cov_24.735537_3_plen_235_part_00